jgi:glutamine phosphoribosylpyrophosphate amidotransferase
MCELMAVAWPEPRPFQSVEGWALELERMGVTGFGWGVAWIDREGDVPRARRHRRPVRMAEDEAGRRDLRTVTSDRFLIHLRRPSKLSTTQEADTQPFVAEDGSFAFCHNGQLRRHEEFRPRFEGRLAGRADSEVGFRFVEALLAEGRPPHDALTATHEQMEGRANFGFLGADGALVVYAGNPSNALWTFGLEDAAVSASGLHSDDTSVFDLVFPHAERRVRLDAGSAVDVAAPGGRPGVARPAVVDKDAPTRAAS